MPYVPDAVMNSPLSQVLEVVLVDGVQYKISFKSI